MTIPKELTTVTQLSRIVAVIVLFATMIIGFALGINYQETIDLFKKQQNSTAPITVNRKTAPTTHKQIARISEEEKQKIDRWITANNLNLYGDPKGTVYLGGTPLFNEATGVRIDRYEYIIKKYLDKPWSK